MSCVLCSGITIYEDFDSYIQQSAEKTSDGVLYVQRGSKWRLENFSLVIISSIDECSQIYLAGACEHWIIMSLALISKNKGSHNPAQFNQIKEGTH